MEKFKDKVFMKTYSRLDQSDLDHYAALPSGGDTPGQMPW